VAATLTLGAGIFLTYPALFSFASEASHRRLQGAAFGFVFFFQLLGGAAGSFAAGVLSDVFSSNLVLEYTAPFWFAGIVSLATVAYLAAVRNRAVSDRTAASARP